MSIKHCLLQFAALFSIWKFTQADSPLISAGPCQEDLFYYENYGSYKCIDGRKVFQNCVPLNEPHSQAIAINSTLITTHFRSICIQYAPDRVQYIRTHCVDSTGEMPKFMRPNTTIEHADKRIRCVFDSSIQTLRKLILYKKKKRVCRHKKDEKMEENVHYQCSRNAYVPDYCVGRMANGTEMRVNIGETKLDYLNYELACQVRNWTEPKAKKGKKNRKKVPAEAALLRVHCLQCKGIGCAESADVGDQQNWHFLEAGQSLEMEDGNGIVRCVNTTKGEVQKRIEQKAPNVTDECLSAFGAEQEKLFSCRGAIFQKDPANGQLAKVGCAEPLRPNQKMALNERRTGVDNNEFECGAEKLQLTACVSTTGKRLNLNESEGDPAGGKGSFERCEPAYGLVIYHENDCHFGANQIALGKTYAVPVEGTRLKPRLLCQKRRLSMGPELKDNLKQKAFWNVLIHKDCVDDSDPNNLVVIPMNGSTYEVNANATASDLVEFCLPDAIIQSKPVGCQFHGVRREPGSRFVIGHDRIECRPDGMVRKIGCFYAPGNLSMALGAIEPLPSQPDILLHCEPDSTGIRMTNGARGCVKEETGEIVPFGSTDEDSNSIRICVRKADPEVRGVWKLTHCLFGTVKVKRGECLFNRTAGPTGVCRQGGEPVGEYKLCEQDANQQPSFLEASYEYCAPSQQLKATDQQGQLVQEQETLISKNSFECDSSWKPKPLPVGLNDTSSPENGEDAEGSGDYADSEEDEDEDGDDSEEGSPKPMAAATTTTSTQGPTLLPTTTTAAEFALNSSKVLTDILTAPSTQTFEPTTPDEPVESSSQSPSPSSPSSTEPSSNPSSSSTELPSTISSPSNETSSNEPQPSTSPAPSFDQLFFQEQQKNPAFVSPLNDEEKSEESANGFDEPLAQALDQILANEADMEAKGRRRKCVQQNNGKCGDDHGGGDGNNNGKVESLAVVSPCRNRLSEHFCIAFKSMCLLPTGKLAGQASALGPVIGYLRHFLGEGDLRNQLRLANTFLYSRLATSYGDTQLMHGQILQIASILPLLPAEDDLAEMLVAEEGTPVLERMLRAKARGDRECIGVAANCSTASAPAALLPLPDQQSNQTQAHGSQCGRHVQLCDRLKVAKLKKQFEALIWHFRQQLENFPHAAIWALCARSCGRCQPPSVQPGWLAEEQAKVDALKERL